MRPRAQGVWCCRMSQAILHRSFSLISCLDNEGGIKGELLNLDREAGSEPYREAIARFAESLIGEETSR